MKTLKQFQEAATGYRKVKSPDEQKFIDKHEVETVADKNGNGDEVFKASNVKKVERKKDRKGYEPGEDESVYEEVEQIDELSTATLQSYRKKARAQGNAIVDKMKMGGGDWSKDQKDTKTLRKRAAGAQMSGKTLRKRGESLKTEETEQLDELSPATKASYVKKAGAEIDKLYDKSKTDSRSAYKYYGRKNTMRKMTKEEADYLINRYADFKENISGLAPRLQEAMHYVLDRLNEENQDKFITACQTEEGLEKMVAFAIENRGE